MAFMGQGAVCMIDPLLQICAHPLHELLALTVDKSNLCIREIIGGKFLQTAVTLMIALDADNDERGFLFIQPAR